MSRLDRWTRSRLVPGHSMGSGDFVKILETYKHPRLCGIGVLSHTSSQANKPREAKGITDRHGTVWVSPRPRDREFLMSVVCGTIPYKGNGKEIAWDEEWGRYVYKHDRMLAASPVMGWKDTLEDLLKGGHITHSSLLSRLLRTNSYDIQPKEWKIW